MRRAAVQVSQEEAKDAPSSSKRTQPASGGFAGYGVEPKKGGVFALDKDVFWFAKAGKDRFRWNMLNPLPLLRQVSRVVSGLAACNSLVATGSGALSPVMRS